MDRHWLLPWTTYGTWLPGDARGFVGNFDRGDGTWHRVNTPGVPYAANMPGLKRMATSNLAGPSVFLSLEHAGPLLEQFLETSQARGWEIHAAAIMNSPVHVALGVPGDPEPDALLRDLKSYGSRRLNRLFDRPQGGTWWTESGSRRKLSNESAVRAAVAYVRNQHHPLAVWIAPRWESADA